MIQQSNLWTYTLKDYITNQRNTCPLMFITALLMIVRKWKQPSCPSPDEGMVKLRAIYTLALYSAIKKIKVVEFEGKWMELEKVLHATDHTDPINWDRL